MIPVEGHKNLFRDDRGYSNYMSDKRRNSDRQAELDDVKKELETLKSMLNELASKITS